MRKLFVAVLVLAALWAGYWAVGAWAIKRGIAAWFAEQRQAGLVAEYSAMSLRGFPSRFDATFTDLNLQEPRDGLGWQAPFFQLFALSYQPQHYIAVWPHEQTLSLPGGEIPVTSRDMRASLVFLPGPSFTLNRSSLVIAGLGVGSGATAWGAEAFNFATRRAVGNDLGHRIGIEAHELALPPALRARLDPQNTLPATLARLHLDATVTFDRPLDRHVLEVAPQAQAIALDDLTAIWGTLSLTLDGTITADDFGYAEGELKVRAENWRQIVGLAVSAGLLPETNRAMVETALTFVAGMSGGTETLTAPLTFKEGRMAFGPIPLGPAPRLHP